MPTRRILLLLAAVASMWMLTGCFNRTVDEQSVPWSRPASWEGQMPGMGGF